MVTPRDIPREEWGLLEPKQVVPHPVTSVGQAVSLFVLHHTVTNESPFVRTLQAIERFHHGGVYFDIAYNAAASNVTDETAVLRGPLTQGGATGNGVDSYSLSCVAVGSFHREGDKRFHEVSDMLINNVAHKAVQWINAGHLSPNFTMDPHREHYETSCCGDALFARIPDIMARVQELQGEPMIVIPMDQWDNHFNELDDFNAPDGVIEWFQDGLTVLGYDPGPIDGQKGPQTRAAWLAFEVDQGYENANDRPGKFSIVAFREALAKVGDTVTVEVPVEVIVEVEVEVPVPFVPLSLSPKIADAQTRLAEAQAIIDSV